MKNLEKFIELFKKLIEYGQASNIPLVQRFFSKSPKLFNDIILYGGVISGVITIVLASDLFPEYNEYLKDALKIIGGAVAIASITKKDTTPAQS